MKLITEVVEDIKVILEETEGGKKNFFIEGIFMQAGVKNRNGRVYPNETLQREAQRYTNEYVAKNRAYGELGHPEGPTINLERVSHMIKDLREDNGNYIGKAKIMDTPYGNIVKSLMSEGATLGVSSRGMGTLKELRGGVMEVQKDFYLATAADIVADPSAPEAFVRGIMENKEWIMENGIFVEHDVERAKRYIDKAAASKDKKALGKAQIKVFENLMNNVSKA